MREGYKMTEVGEIPENWKAGTLGMMAEIVMGQSPNGETYNTIGNGVPMLNGPTEFTSKFPIPVQYTTKPTKFSKKGDILFCVRGSSTGRMNLSDQEYCIGRGLAAIRGKSNSNTKYLYYILQNLAEDVLRKAKDMGSTFPNVNSTEINKRPIAIPSLYEQNKIAEILSTVDEKIEVIEEQINQTTELKKGLMQRLITKGIGHTQFKDSVLGEIPESWEIQELSELVAKKKHAIVDGPFGSNLKTEHYRSSGIPIISSGHVTNGYFLANDYLYVDQEKFEKEKRSSVKGGDIIMAKIGARCGASAILPLSHQTSILSGNALKISFDEKENNTLFYAQVLKLYYQDGTLDKIKTTGAQPAISLNSLKKLKFVRPSLYEQQKIASILNTIDEKLHLLQEKKEKCFKLKKGLMQQLLTGKLRVNHLIEKSVPA